MLMKEFPPQSERRFRIAVNLPLPGDHSVAGTPRGPKLSAQLKILKALLEGMQVHALFQERRVALYKP
jgi:hypothetical protein